MTTIARDALRPVQGRVRSIGKSAANLAKDTDRVLTAAADRAEDLYDTGRSMVGRIEDRPLFSVLVALGLGLVAGTFLRPR